MAKKKKVVILGCGRVGARLARALIEEGHEVIVIDHNADQFRRLGEHFPGKTVLGDGLDIDVLAGAGIEGADVFVAATNGDNTNVMSAQVACRRFKVCRSIVRMYDPIRAGAYREEFGINTICPTEIVSDLIQREIGEA